MPFLAQSVVGKGYALSDTEVGRCFRRGMEERGMCFLTQSVVGKGYALSDTEVGRCFRRGM
jgi:hypothetical protein